MKKEERGTLSPYDGMVTPHTLSAPEQRIRFRNRAQFSHDSENPHNPLYVGDRPPTLPATLIMKKTFQAFRLRAGEPFLYG